MRTGRLLGAGRTADVYELHADEGESGPDDHGGLGALTEAGDPVGVADSDGADRHTGGVGQGDAWVLRRYREGWGDAATEAEVMEYVRSHGYPVPRVHSATRTEMVLQRLPGPTLLEACAAGQVTPPQVGATLAQLLRTLHAVPPRRPGARVLHLDLHPENVLLTPHGPQVIDWSNAEEGPPGLDWAVSAMILAQVAVDPTDARAPMAHATLSSLLAHRPDNTLTHHDLTEASHRRASNPTMSPHEIELLARAEELIRDAPEKAAGL
ncbi:phosphotransferase [Streptomyces sp. SP18BB07]|uniref:phosphotransferase n=1 Tax=Streptomyces sp. SP18BB07 TaxID=3002522 RepID=UPI002E76BA3F|nr:phosphotransferase [Streptomyces sp. SP18BB07]MEE1766392.1 phosphotransferase [Streptomyces sp. SP18BB07]